MKKEKSQEEIKNDEEYIVCNNDSDEDSDEIKNIFDCPDCNKTFRNPRTLKSHLSNDCGRTYTCRCKKTFSYLSSYYRHKKRCTTILRKKNRRRL